MGAVCYGMSILRRVKFVGLFAPRTASDKDAITGYYRDMRDLLRDVTKGFSAHKETCVYCGREAELSVVDEAVSIEVLGDASKHTCIRCFTRLAAQRGIGLVWHAEVYRDQDS